MSSETSVKYAVYDLRTYFSCQPGEIMHCPICGSLPSKSAINPSRAVADYLTTATMPEHEFSCLYECSTCQWWAVWESWGDREFGGQDFSSLIVSVIDGTEKIDLQATPWHQILEDADIYRNELPLPDTLGKLFASVEKIRSDVLKPGDKICIRANITVRQPFDDAYQLAIRGSQGTIVSLTEFKAAYEPQLKELYKIENPENEFFFEMLQLMFEQAQEEIRQGIRYAVRLEKIEPTLTSRSGDHNLCKAGEIYLIETSYLEKMD